MIDYDAIAAAGGISKGPHRMEEKLAKRAAEAKALRECFRAVDARDQGRCRVCGRACSPVAIAMVDRAERHHMVFRSKGGAHESRNVITLCKRTCHNAIHAKGILKVSGDADLRNERGQLCGVQVEELKEHGWQIVKWV